MLIEREAKKNLFQALNSGKIVILTGARQVGKTTLIQSALADRAVTMLNFDLPFDVARFRAASVLPAAEGLQSLGDPDFLVIDEAQREPDVAKIIKGWYDAKLPVTFILLGSSALNLLSLTAETLTGRNRKLTLPPLTMQEALQAESWYQQNYPNNVLEREMQSQFRNFLLKSMVFGGYPEVVTSSEKIPLLRELAGDYLWKDILQSGLVKTPDQIRRLLMLLAYQIGSEVSVNEIAQQLAMSRQTVDRYLDLLEETFVIFRLSSFSTNPRKEIAKGKKIYFWDTGIRNAVLNQFDLQENRPDIGALFENYLIAELMKRNLRQESPAGFYFWRTYNGSEIDLVIKANDHLKACEIKWLRNRGKKTAFENEYKIPVEILTADTPSQWWHPQIH